MATAPENPNEDDTLELPEDQQVTEPDEVQDDEQQTDDNAEVNDADEEETVIGFGDDDADQPGDSSVIRQLRQELRETKRELRERAPVPQKIEIGEKPTLAGCDYDEEKFETELEAYNGRKADADAQERKRQETDAEVQRAWEEDVETFRQKKAKLAVTVPDVDDAQATVEAGLDLVQQAVLVKASDDPALLMVALARNPAKLAELAKIKDPIKMAAAIARMEGTVKVTTKRKAPAIDTPQRGSGAIISADKYLEKLEAEADKSGDRSKVIAYKREQRAKAEK